MCVCVWVCGCGWMGVEWVCGRAHVCMCAQTFVHMDAFPQLHSCGPTFRAKRLPEDPSGCMECVCVCARARKGWVPTLSMREDLFGSMFGGPKPNVGVGACKHD